MWPRLYLNLHSPSSPSQSASHFCLPGLREPAGESCLLCLLRAKVPPVRPAGTQLCCVPAAASRHGIASCPAVFGSRQGACLPYLGSKRLLIRRPVLYFPLRPRVFLTARSPPYSWTLHAQIHTMTSSSSSPPPTSFLEQTVSVISSVAGYMRLPAMASTGVAAVLTSLLYFKQK